MMSRTVIRALLAALSIVVLALASPALANEASISDPVGDGAAGHPDIVSVSMGHASPGRVEHAIVADEAFATPDAPCLALHSIYPHDGQFEVCGDGKLHRLSDGSVVATAEVARPDGKTVVYRFAWQDLGGSSAYRWRAESRAAACPLGRCDVAPAQFTLHARHVTYEQWALRFLQEVDAKNCAANRIAVVAWEVNEGTAAVFNPLATTYDMPGSTQFNSTGVRNYISMEQGLDASRLTIEHGWSTYGYGPIVERLRKCAPAMWTAKAIRASSWCHGCSGGQYVTGLIIPVRKSYASYAARDISTYSTGTHSPEPLLPGAPPDETPPL